MRQILFVAGFMFLLASALVAQEQAPMPDSSAMAITPPDSTIMAPEETGPVAVPEMSDKAARYYRSGNVLWFVNRFWGLLIPALFLFTGFSAKIRNWAQQLGRKWFFVIGLYFVIFTVMNFIIDLPLAYYQGFVRQHAYDLSNQTFGKWFGDSLKELMVGLIMGVLFLWVPYLLLKKSPQRWWLYTSILAVPFLFFVMLISPIWIDPLFNKFGPMNDKVLEAKILTLAEQAGIEGSRVYEVNKSIDTKAVNAYVTGFMNTKRIVLWDTIIAKLKEKELLFVMGHEMGHYVLDHVIKGILFFSVLILLTLYAAYRVSGALINKFKDRWGFDQLSDIASLPLIILLVSVFSLVITPIALTFSRYQEHEADRFGLEITQTNHAAATAFVKLQQENLGNPRPGLLYKLWRSSHPTLGDRIDFCNAYRPWERGEKLKYEKLFKR
jgi:Zn-dependent protease with chaperone function